MIEIVKKAKIVYEKGYKNRGLDHQRKYPNEELCRFFGRNFFSIKAKQRKKIKILETGSGTCGNLQMISKEGFSTYGIDFSEEAIKLSRKLFKKEKLKGHFTVGDFTSMSYKNSFFDSVIDVFSSCTLDKYNGQQYIKEVNRILKIKGKFFSYFPAKKSDMFNFKTRKLHDKDTLISLKQKSAYTTDHALRFMSLNQYCNMLNINGFKINYKEEVMRTYFSTKEKFYFLVIEAIKV
jgi:ubiquinone/menaquinone biosynthesis C-methylase UbiE